MIRSVYDHHMPDVLELLKVSASFSIYYQVIINFKNILLLHVYVSEKIQNRACCSKIGQRYPPDSIYVKLLKQLVDCSDPD